MTPRFPAAQAPVAYPGWMRRVGGLRCLYPVLFPVLLVLLLPVSGQDQPVLPVRRARPV